MNQQTALLIVDVQTGVMDFFPVHRRDDVLNNLNQLLAQARAALTPVIYIQHDGSPAGHPLEPQTPGWPIHPAIAPQADEPIIRKTACDSFFATALQNELQQRGITHLVIAGCVTEFCVDTTCRSAVARGYDVTLVADAHTTVDNEVLTAAQIINHHNRLLNGLRAGARQIVVKPCAEISF